jgi:hypothetical protein
MCPMSPFLFGCRVVTLMTFPLVTMLRKGPLHLEQRIYDFVLPGLWRPCCLQLRRNVFVLYFHLNFFATDNELKGNDPFTLLFKMSWYEITKKVRVLTKGTSRTSTGIKKINASRKRLFRVASMSCACLLMNTAATVSMSVVLEDWSVSSDQWLTCTVVETSLTRNWANYGFHVGDRYFLFGS